MSAEQILLTIIAIVGAIVGLFKIVLPRFVDAKIQADEYERERSAGREDKAFKMLEVSLEQRMRADIEARQEARTAHEVQTALIAEVGKLVANIDRQTEMISRQTDMIRILIQDKIILKNREDRKGEGPDDA
jgi:hypothetical protein